VIPPAMRRGVLDVLPDRCRFVVMLDATDNLACPCCRRAMAFGFLTQEIAPTAPAAIAATWRYLCLACSPS